MGLLDDLLGIGQAALGTLGPEATKDSDCPPSPPAVPLSQRTQRYLSALLGSMNQAYAAFVNTLPSELQDQANIQTRGGFPSNLGSYITNENQLQAAQDYLDYAQWVIPYLQACGDLSNGYYTGQGYLNAIDFMQVTANDFTKDENGKTAFDIYAQPHLDLAKYRRDSIRFAPLVGGLPQVQYRNVPPVLPPTSTGFFQRQADHLLGNDLGDSNAGTIAEVLGVGLLVGTIWFAYMVLRK